MRTKTRKSLNRFEIYGTVVKIYSSKINGKPEELLGQCDLIDYNIIKDYTWHRHSGRYLGCAINKHTVFMHNMIMQPEEGQEVDHIDRDGTNCTRGNMRLVNHRENCMNRHYSNNTSGKQGVSYNKANGYWFAYYYDNGKQITIKNSRIKEVAIQARIDWEVERLKGLN